MPKNKTFDVSPFHLALVNRCARSLPELGSMPKEDYLDWLLDNEEIYNHFRRFALDALNRGRRKFSVYMIRERVRWYVNVESRGPGEFKISNNLTPYIARTLVLDDDRFYRIFNTKGPE